MYRSSFKLDKNSSVGNNDSNASKDSKDSVDDLRERVAIRFLLKKTKRFDCLNQQLKERFQQKQRKMQQAVLKAGVSTTSSPECLLYLGLAPKNSKKHDRKHRKEENLSDSFQFIKPRVYECGYCTKIFFHKLPYRRHMIRHLKKIHWCLKCNRGFTRNIYKRRHVISCRR